MFREQCVCLVVVKGRFVGRLWGGELVVVGFGTKGMLSGIKGFTLKFFLFQIFFLVFSLYFNFGRQIKIVTFVGFSFHIFFIAFFLRESCFAVKSL